MALIDFLASGTGRIVRIVAGIVLIAIGLAVVEGPPGSCWRWWGWSRCWPACSTSACSRRCSGSHSRDNASAAVKSFTVPPTTTAGPLRGRRLCVCMDLPGH